MPIYNYKGLDRSGKEVKNSLNSESIIAAKQKVKSLGIMLIDIKEQKAQSGASKSVFSFKGKVSVEDLALMTRQFATLIKAKIQIVEALQFVVPGF